MKSSNSLVISDNPYNSWLCKSDGYEKHCQKYHGSYDHQDFKVMHLNPSLLVEPCWLEVHKQTHKNISSLVYGSMTLTSSLLYPIRWTSENSCSFASSLQQHSEYFLPCKKTVQEKGGYMEYLPKFPLLTFSTISADMQHTYSVSNCGLQKLQGFMSTGLSSKTALFSFKSQ